MISLIRTSWRLCLSASMPKSALTVHLSSLSRVHEPQLTCVGCIINVSSLMATKGGSGATAYAASKAGVVGKCFTSLDLSHSIPGCYTFQN